MRTTAFVLLLLLSLLSTGRTTAQFQTWVVDDNGGPGADFTTIQAAVDATTDLDVVLVKGGNYDGFTIDGRSLTVVGEAGEVVDINAFMAQINVANLVVGQRVVLRNIDSSGAAHIGIGLALVRLRNCAGPVWLDNCSIVGPGGFNPLGGAAVDAQDCASVVISNCTLLGQVSDNVSQGANAGLCLLRSNVTLMDSLAQGGLGLGGAACSSPSTGSGGCPASIGGNGVTIDAGSLFVSGSTLAGGNGGAGQDSPDPFLFCGAGADGGDGLNVLFGSSGPAKVRLLDATLTGGTGGAGGVPQPGDLPCTNGIDGAGSAGWLADVASLPGSARSLTVNSPVREGGSLSLTMAGVPGDVVLLTYSLAPSTGFGGPWVGQLHTNPPLFLLGLGTLPAGGGSSVAITVPQLAPAFEGITVFAQTAHMVSTGLPILGTPRSIVVLDSAF